MIYYSRYLFVFSVLCLCSSAFALEVVELNGKEEGFSLRPHLLIWSDPKGNKSIEQAYAAFEQGEFIEFTTKGSVGFHTGALWSHFNLSNTTAKPIVVHLEYIDHQLIYLNAFRRSANDSGFSSLASMSLYGNFQQREIPHHRFVFPVTINPGETVPLFVRYASDNKGFIFPGFRVWNPHALSSTQRLEFGFFSFFAGGLFFMAVIAFVGGAASDSRSFYIYVSHALAAIVAWCAVLGFAHEFVVQENFHWRVISLPVAFSFFTGIWFARYFLQTRKFIPRFDYILIFMLCNVVFLIITSLLDELGLVILSVTISLLLYPFVSVAAFIRWRQGSGESLLFAVAWIFLVIALFSQALRDLGFIEHNLVTYYWPVFASYTEMTVILVAMSIRVRRLNRLKEKVEHLYS